MNNKKLLEAAEAINVQHVLCMPGVVRIAMCVLMDLMCRQRKDLQQKRNTS